MLERIIDLLTGLAVGGGRRGRHRHATVTPQGDPDTDSIAAKVAWAKRAPTDSAP